MRIGIDARFWGPRESGIGRYVDRLISHLHQLSFDHDVVIFLRHDALPHWPYHHPRWKIVSVGARWYSIREQLEMPFRFAKERLDILHVPHFNVPLLYRGATVVTIHDLILEEFPTERASTLAPIIFRLKMLAYKLSLRNAVLHARRVITISQHSRQALLRQFPSIDHKVVITYEAVDPLPEAVHWEQLAAHGIVQPYFLYAGNTYPHKNLERFVQAFALHLQRHPDSHVVLVGKRDFFSKRLEQFVRAAQIPNITFFGYASDAELHALYKHCQAYFFPSMSEGFGLPGLEAMECGAPVFAALASSLPEIYGDAASYFDPLSVEAIATSMDRAVRDILEVQRLRDAGYRQIQRYSWTRMAEETRDVYESALHHAGTKTPTTRH
jgi:glycosyltransferase involved in cell wall biosynthesis